MKKLATGLLLLSVLVWGGILFFSGTPEVSAAPTLTAEQSRWKAFSDRFVAPWNNECRPVAKAIKETMHDAGSYEHIKTEYASSEDGTYYVVTTSFRGKNAIGAKVINTVEANVSNDGKILEFTAVK